MNYKERIKIMLLLIILSGPLFPLSAQIPEEFGGMKTGFSPKSSGYECPDTTGINQDSRLKRIFYGDISLLTAGDQFLLDSTISYIFFSPNDSMLNNREVFTYLPDGKIETFIKDTIENPYYPSLFLYMHMEGRYTYNSEGKLILYTDSYGEEAYTYDEEGRLLQYRNTSGSDETLESYEYSQDGIIQYMSGSMKSCIYMTSHECLQWDNPDTYEVYYNSAGIPDSSYASYPVARYFKYDHLFDEENKLVYYEENTYNTMRKLVGKIIITEIDTLENAVVNRRKTIFYEDGVKTLEFDRTSISEFDENGNRVKGWWYNYNFDARKLVLEVIDSLIYDENNLLKEFYSFGYGGSFKGDIHLTTFDYDQDGNLVQKMRYNRGFMDLWALYMKEWYYYSAAGPAGTISGTLSGIHLFPNPAHDFVRVSLPSTYPEAGFRYEIYDLRGALIQSGISDDSSSIDISGCSEGVYLLRLRDKRTGNVLGYLKMIKR